MDQYRKRNSLRKPVEHVLVNIIVLPICLYGWVFQELLGIDMLWFNFILDLNFVTLCFWIW